MKGGPEFQQIGSPPEQLSTLISPLLDRPGAFVLESGGPVGPYSRWTYLGWKPSFVLRGDLGSAIVQDMRTGRELTSGRGFTCLSWILNEIPTLSIRSPVPFCGGGVGFIGYEAGREFENLPATSKRSPAMPHLYWAFYNEILAIDRVKKNMWKISRPGVICGKENSLSPVDELLEEAKQNKNRSRKESSINANTSDPMFNMNREEYEQMVQRARDYIRKGDIYQVNLSRRVQIDSLEDPGPIYKRLRRVNATPYGGYIRGPDFAVLSSSPELFIRVRDHSITTRPIKGTRPRGDTPETDEKLKQELLNSEKDLAELHMIVDLERNDLGRICKYGTVNTTELHTIETYPELHHLVATVNGTMREDTNLLDILRATFPGGSITGAPKIRSMEIIDELEPTRRQVYTGSMGWIGFNGDLELNICIRTMEWKNKRLVFQVGGGIVMDSNPADEFEETQTKARGMLNSLSLLS